MTLQSLYQIRDVNSSNGEFSATVSFNPDHDIFKGHFPGQPVVPGVCLIHILKDLCSKIVETNVKLVKGTNIKFLNIIDPQDKDILSISGTLSEKEDNTISLSAVISKEEMINIKFKGIFSY